MVVTVVGLGFVGLTTALGFAQYGHKVYGVEINKERLETIKSGKLPFLEPELDNALIRHLGAKFIPTDSWDEGIKDSDCVYFCVGTPYGENGEADLTYLFSAIDSALRVASDDKFRVFVTKSTIPPSTSSQRIIPFIESLGKKVGIDIGVANNPEFLREGHCWDDFINADRIVLGVAQNDKQSELILRDLYANCGCAVHVVSLNTGEFIKYLSNTVLATLISYANEMSIAADIIGDIDIAGAFRILHEDKRWQNGSIRSYFYPGCGYGGYCLPKDTNAFHAVLKQNGFNTPILENVIKTNDRIPEVATNRVLNALSNNKNAKIGILGLSFNVGSDDVRDTPSAKIIKNLMDQGYSNICAYDPVAINEFKKLYNFSIKYENNLNTIISNSDILVITTAWQEFKNLKEVTNKQIVDLRYML